MKLILSTSNIMSGGPSVIRRVTSDKSNVELLNALRSNFVAAQHIEPSHTNGTSLDIHDVPQRLSYSDYTTWTSKQGDTLYVPSINFSEPGLIEDRDQYDITVKLFYLPGTPTSRRCAHTKEAIDLVLKELHTNSIDLLIVSFPGISFDADDSGEDISDGDSSNHNNGNNDLRRRESESGMDGIIQTWRVLESLKEQGMISQLGLSEFDSERLAEFLPHAKILPAVDQINVKDCCVVPKPLIVFAKQKNIKLLTHNDCTDILPPGTTRDLLARGERGAGILAASATAEDGGLKGEIEPQWVVKYTAVVKDRGVIENKGYFALAEVRDCM
ncbi:glutamate-cysteine ligase regulatory subunit [Histoplasma capsulatum G186AR]|nr:glutamate-cysteine ligase regulatory subunit [Histoplasma capsulatum]QSS75397.1 glutamate-cysteine ligase regulatory subunit [Histoplasma capsulatum G186AR]